MKLYDLIRSHPEWEACWSGPTGTVRVPATKETEPLIGSTEVIVIVCKDTKFAQICCRGGKAKLNKYWKANVTPNQQLLVKDTRLLTMSKIKIEGIPRGTIGPDGWYFTSYRFPLELAQQLDALAKAYQTSLSNVVVSILKHGIPLCHEDLKAAGIQLPESDLEASKHAKPTTTALTVPKQKKDKKAAAAIETLKQFVASPGKVKASISVPKVLTVKAEKVEDEEEVEVPKPKKKSGFKVNIKHKGGK